MAGLGLLLGGGSNQAWCSSGEAITFPEQPGSAITGNGGGGGGVHHQAPSPTPCLLSPTPWLGARPSPRGSHCRSHCCPGCFSNCTGGQPLLSSCNSELRTLRRTHRTWSHARLLSSRGHLAHWWEWDHLVVLRKPTDYFAGIRGARSAHVGQLRGWVVWRVLEREGGRWRSKSKSKSKSDPSWTSKQVQVQSPNPNKVRGTRVGLRNPKSDPSWTSKSKSKPKSDNKLDMDFKSKSDYLNGLRSPSLSRLDFVRSLGAGCYGHGGGVGRADRACGG
jgi:hypothetical protein